MSEPEIDNSMETFMTLFNKMFSETKYNLQALNKRMESMDKCFCNVLLLSSDKPFDEENIEENNDIQNNENINEDNIPKRKRNAYNISKNKKNKMTEEDLDEIEKMFRNIDEDPTPNPSYNEKKNIEIFLNKKRKNKKTEEKNEIKDSKNLFNDIKELLKTYSLDNEEENKNEIKNEEKPKKKRGRKKKKENDSESNEDGDVDYLVPEKNDGFSKFKEFKELKKKVGNNIYNKSSEEDDDEDDIDSDF